MICVCGASIRLVLLNDGPFAVLSQTVRLRVIKGIQTAVGHASFEACDKRSGGDCRALGRLANSSIRT